MNLNALVGPLVGNVNPSISITVQKSTGYTIAADGTQQPTYTTSTVTGQVQPLSEQDLKRLEGLNAQDVTYKVFLNGDFEGVFRKTGRGGDLLSWGGNTYLVTAVIERWPDWTAVGVTLQMD